MKKMKRLMGQVLKIIILPFEGAFSKSDEKKEETPQEKKESFVCQKNAKEEKEASTLLEKKKKTTQKKKPLLFKQNDKIQQPKRNDSKKEHPKIDSFIPIIEVKHSLENSNREQQEEENLEELSREERIQEGLIQVLSSRQQLLNELIVSYNKINQEYEKADNQKEVASLIEEIEEILIKLIDLEKQMESLKEKGDIQAISDLEEVLLKDLSNLSAFNEKTVISYIEQSDQYKYIVSKMDEVDEKSSSLEEKLEEKKEYLEQRDDKFHQFFKETDEVITFEDQLYKDCLYLDQEAKDLEEKASKEIEITQKIQYRFDVINKSSLLFLTALTVARKEKKNHSIPMTLLTGLLAIQVGKNLVQGRTVVSYIKSYSDYSKEIEAALTSVDDLKKFLKKSQTTVEKLEEDFCTTFHEELKDHKEYQNVLFLIQNVKDGFHEKEEQLVKTEASLNESMIITKEKVKKLQR